MTDIALALDWAFGPPGPDRWWSTVNNEITSWNHPTDSQPTPEEINQLLVDFAAVEDDYKDNMEIKNEFETSRIRILLFEINYDQENRIRILEGLSTISKAQYRDALLAQLQTI